MIATSSVHAVRILLVEDHAETRKALARLLTSHGFVVIDAENLAEAKRLTLEEDHFNLVVSDVGLPDGSGVELMEWLREKTPGLPGIALTAYGAERDVAATKEAGFSTHLTKPITFETLYFAILRYVSPTQH